MKLMICELDWNTIRTLLFSFTISVTYIIKAYLPIVYCSLPWLKEVNTKMSSSFVTIRITTGMYYDHKEHGLKNVCKTSKLSFVKVTHHNWLFLEQNS